MKPTPIQPNRELWYVVVAIAIATGAFILGQGPQEGSPQGHVLLESIGVVTALATGLIALVRFYSRRTDQFVYLGLGLIGAAWLDSYHAAICHVCPREEATSLLYWSWTGSRLFLAVMVAFSCANSWNRKDRRGLNRYPDALLYCGICVLVSLAMLLSATVELPNVVFPELWIPRPIELVPAAIFSIALISYLREGRWREHNFEHAIVLALIVSVLGEALFAARSEFYFDAFALGAQAMKFGSYLIIFSGLLVHIHESFQAADLSEEQALLLGTASARFQRQANELRNARSALVNMMEDSDQARMASEKARSELLRKTDELEASNRQLEQFAYVASHDMKEPLRMIASYLRLLEEEYKGALSEDADKFIHYAVDGANRMQKMIDDILQYARITKDDHNREPVDLTDVLQTVRQDLLHSIQTSDTRVIADPLPVILGDRTQIQQLFQNLLSNAIKFRGEHSPIVHIECQWQGDDWQLTVRDNGIGIAEDQQQRIFGVFERLHPRRKYEGTGIGLAICKKIVDQHLGKIWVESKPGEGTAVHFTLPQLSDSSTYADLELSPVASET